MEAEIGTRSVLAALGDTIAAAEPTDLKGTTGSQPPRTRPASDPEPDRYVLRQCLGRGGLGEVHEAFDLDLRRPVALKRPRGPEQNAATTLLVREAQITAQLEHPGVPSVHGLGLRADRSPFFTMTLVRGRTLTRMIELGLGERPALRLIVQLAYALAFAHERGVVHRDIKPDNIMIGAFGEVRLMDWGIAKLVDRPDQVAGIELGEDVSHQTEVGAFVGTPGFAAPEQIAGADDLDARADVFALGAVLYQVLTGRALFTGTAMERITHTLDEQRPPVRLGEGLSRELAAVVSRATAHDRDHRYASVTEMIRDIEAYLDGERVRAFRPTTWQRMLSMYHLRGARARRLRAIDVDLIIAGHGLAGIGLGIALLHVVALPGWVGPLLFVVGMSAGLLPAYTLLRRERRADTDRPSRALSEGLRSRPQQPEGIEASNSKPDPPHR